MKWWDVEVREIEAKKRPLIRGSIRAASEESARTRAPHWAGELGKNRRPFWEFETVSVKPAEEFVPSTGFATEVRRGEHTQSVKIRHLRDQRLEVTVSRSTDLRTLRWGPPEISCPGRGSLTTLEAMAIMEIMGEAVKAAEAMEDESPTIWETRDEIAKEGGS